MTVLKRCVLCFKPFSVANSYALTTRICSVCLDAKGIEGSEGVPGYYNESLEPEPEPDIDNCPRRGVVGTHLFDTTGTCVFCGYELGLST